jgi:FkbM family methyltransferase
MILNYNEIINDSNVNVKGVIHIGAFYGQEKNTYNNLNFDKVIWIDANPNYENIIRENVGDDIIIISGIGNINGTLTFNIANNGQSSSFLEFGTHLDEHPGINFTEKIEVPIKRMVDVINEYNINIDEYNFLNVDIQGYELEAFKGFDNQLNNFDFIYCEVNEKELYKGCPLIDDIDEYLNTYNFKRVLTNMTEHGWGDAFYIKNNI